MLSLNRLSFRSIPGKIYAVRSFSMSTRTFTAASKLKPTDLNQNTLEAKYAVRGRIPIKADELHQKILSDPTDHGLPFDNIISANIGNPQQLDQKPLTWYRQVLSILQYPKLLDHTDVFPEDVIARAKYLLDHTGSLGAYSHSQGNLGIRKSVAKFITNRDDGHVADPSNIFLTSGASAAVSYLLQILSKDTKSGFLIPIPQYPLYTATIALNNSKPIGYFLDESHHWSTNPEQIRSLIKENQAEGVDIKALVVINPGNPTGSILSRDDIVDLIDIAAEYGIVLISDEVYQENVFESGGGKFVSMKKVLSELLLENEAKYSNVQLASLHSTSKGVSGECGQRGGYMELVGFAPAVKDVIFKLASINLCSVVSGQALMELMINPPQPGSPSYEVYHAETSKIHNDLQTRSTALYEAFSEMTDISCNKPQGAMYLFPKLNFTKATYPELFLEANEFEVPVDELYCMKLLERTGICCVPGSGFGQVPDTFHLRTTFLPPGKEWVDRWAKFHEEFVHEYKK
ncbi:probable alanine aminotransferase [[Candida] railenensis]|uniref:Glutamate pyruvate transaminase n=1 Tax=[Candida] railenensis TaxID=45579 RepID=A0A9P0W173_9ASCO|nr:probable alanine aminotransferase [[Candida] railenensis]